MTTTEFIPTFRTSHDPDDLGAVRNVWLGGVLRRMSGVYDSSEVAVVEGPDSSLTITTVAFDPTKLRLSFHLTGGVPGKYKIRLRVTTTDGRRFDRSVWQIVRDK